jgi:hypothetical protein
MRAAAVAVTTGDRDAADHPAHEDRDGQGRSGPFQDPMHASSAPYHQ